MNTYWEKLSKQQINTRVFDALRHNADFYHDEILGVPASHLDDKVFYQDAPFLRDAPFLTALIHNPNHIGCHTLGGETEHFFKGTQAIERELVGLCAEKILSAAPGSCDGYIAAGGTEANLQAVWIYRNRFMRDQQIPAGDICLLCSADSHYSVAKAANVFGIRLARVAVDDDTRAIQPETLDATLDVELARGTRAFIVVANMMTTMFGSVDQASVYTRALKARELPFFLHVDGAYGGFFYPFTDARHELDFANPDVSSVTLDAHKMVQAPYGTGIFVARKGLMAYARTPEASYVAGEDSTLIGSRSGANAIAVWMILMTYGRFGWEEKIMVLQKRSQWLADQLDRLGLRYFREPHANILTLRAEGIDPAIAERFGLVPDNHHQPRWYKVVVMDHVTIEKLLKLVRALEGAGVTTG
ncbi:MAG: aspartate aminotransferase family protein [Bacteroidetes bacterium]|nr:MAG: aspartate aminotransferase family protein [Bacteroidota bacterium]